ncbi:MAG: SMC-Scp complex subunit ScpB [Bacteroidota bacterium]
MQLLKQHIEALIFCSENSITLDEIQASLKLSMGWETNDEELLAAIEEIKQKYLTDDFSFELSEIAEGYQFLTKKEFHGTLTALIQHKAKKKLSVAQMETLAIIAYKQPISKTEIEHIRGVNCDYAVQKLLEKEMIVMQGKSDGPGRPMLYATSQNFMDYFGIKSTTDLPQLKDLRAPQNEIGMSSESMEDMPSEVETLVLNETNTDEVVFSEVLEPGTTLSEATDETLVTDENPDSSELPDRKKIFLENENLAEETPGSINEISSSTDEEELPS